MGGDQLVRILRPLERADLRSSIDFVQQVAVDRIPKPDPFIGRSATGGE